MTIYATVISVTGKPKTQNAQTTLSVLMPTTAKSHKDTATTPVNFMMKIFVFTVSH
jgi:hypothetical protein